MFKSLRLQLLFYFFITNIVVLLTFSLFLYSTAQKGVSDTLDSQLRIVSYDAGPDLKIKGYADAKTIADELMDEFEIKPLYVRIIYYNKNDNAIEHSTVSSRKHAPLFEIPLNIMGRLHSIYYSDKERFRVSSMLLLEDETTKVFFQLAAEKTIHSPYLKQLVISLLIANPIILILFLFIANILINRTLAPVQKVVETVRSLSHDQFSQRIDYEDIPTEIKALVQTFNELLEDIEEAFDRITAFSSDASHELKTPLTVIRGEVEVGLRQDRTAAEYKAILQNVVQETIQVQDTIDQLFLLTKKDTKELKENFEELYLDEVLIDVVTQIQRFASLRSVQIKVTDIIPVTITGHETLLKVALSNLLRNSIIYSKEGSEIRVSISEDTGHYILKIEDEGCGISTEEIPFIFDRFYRSDKMRSRQSGGTGLGLAIVKMILDLHHFEIEVMSKIDVGTQMIIKILK